MKTFATSCTPLFGRPLRASARSLALMLLALGLSGASQAWANHIDHFQIKVVVNPVGAGEIIFDASEHTAGYHPNTVVLFRAVPSGGGSSFGSWGGAANGTSSDTTVTIQSNTLVVANFNVSNVPAENQVHPLILLSSPENVGEIQTDPAPQNGGYRAGTVVTLKGSPNVTTMVFSRFSGGVTGTVNPTTYVVGTVNPPITAHFSAADGTPLDDQGHPIHPPHRLLNFSVVPAGSGNIVADPVMPNDGYHEGTQVTLSAVPAGTATFTGWSGGLASGSANPVTVTVGANYLDVVANFSSTQPPANTNGNTLVIQTSGNGKVSPNLSGRTLVPGKVYRLTAQPDKGMIFAGWSGVTNSEQKTLALVMQPNAVVVANFVPDPFKAVAGIYSGLLYNSMGETQDASGFFSLSVTTGGRYSGKLILANRTVPLSGIFNSTGSALFSFDRGARAIKGQLQLDLVNGTDQISGSVTNVANVWVASLLGDRAIFTASTNLAPFAGTYNLVFSQENASTGTGLGTATINGAGLVKFTGTLADGSRVSQATYISKNGQWPLFLPLYSGRGSAIGWVTVTNLAQSSLVGSVTWARPDFGARKLFPGGFTNQWTVLGSLFIPSLTGKSPLLWTNGLATLRGGGMLEELQVPLALDARQTLTSSGNSASPVVKWVVSPKNGSVIGTFGTNASAKKKIVTGLVLPKTNWVAGQFQGTSSVGSVMVIQDGATTTGALIEPPVTMEGHALTLTATRRQGDLAGVGDSTLSFTNGSEFAANSQSLGNGVYNYSSYPSVGASVSELNLVRAHLRNRSVVVRVLLHFTSSTSGNYRAAVVAGGSGLAEGSFSIDP